MQITPQVWEKLRHFLCVTAELIVESCPGTTHQACVTLTFDLSK